MKKIESDLLRYRVFTFIISILILIIFFLLTKRVLWQTVVLLSFVTILFPYFIIKDEKNIKHSAIFFSNTGLSTYFENKTIVQIDWNNVSVSKIKSLSINNSILLKCFSNDNPEEVIFININWFNEISILELSKEYVPRNHSFYQVIQDYATSRKINF